MGVKLTKKKFNKQISYTFQRALLATLFVSGATSAPFSLLFLPVLVDVRVRVGGQAALLVRPLVQKHSLLRAAADGRPDAAAAGFVGATVGGQYGSSLAAI